MRRTNRSPLAVLALALTLTAGCQISEILNPTFTLTVTQSGDGSVSSNPQGISTVADGGSSSSDYAEGTVVTLTATPAAGFVVASWGGNCSTATGTSCQVTLNANRSASVTFAPVATQFTLSMTKTGSGSVSSSPAGLSIATGGTSGSASFDDGTAVTITATPDAGFEISAWGGDCSAATNTCQLTMSADRSASVTFTPVTGNNFTLNVTKSGNGTVTSSPAGISIATGGTSGAATFAESTVVTLTAAPDTGWRVAAWSGAGCTGNGDTCQVTMDANESVSLVIELIPTGSDLSTGVPVTGLSGTAGSTQVFKLVVPAAASSVRFEIFGGTGDVNLRSRFGSEPTFAEFDCRPGQPGSEESCNHGNPSGGDWYAEVRGITDFSGLTLIGYYQVDPAGFSIQIVFDPSTSGWTAAEVAAITDGIRRWESMITDDLDGVWSDGGCGTTEEQVNEYVDDFLIYVSEGAIDGVSNTLAQAGYCSRRQVDDAVFAPGDWFTGYENTLPYFGNMTFDEADVSLALASGKLADVATHEMGHALGLLPLGSDAEFNHIQGPDADPFWAGTAAIARFNAAGGVGSEIPVEPVVKAHWDENAFDDEIMSPTIKTGDELPLSPITLGALEDLGYMVDYSAADSYTYTPTLSLVAGAGREDREVQAYMINDVLWYVPPRRVQPQPEPRR